MVSKIDDQVWISWLATTNNIQDGWPDVYIMISYG
jgi:hypothetical protein